METKEKKTDSGKSPAQTVQEKTGRKEVDPTPRDAQGRPENQERGD